MHESEPFSYAQDCPERSLSCRDEDEDGEEDDEEYEDEEDEEEAEGDEGAAAADQDLEGADEASLGGDDFDDDDEEYTDLSKGSFFCAEVKANGLPIGPGVPTEVSSLRLLVLLSVSDPGPAV